MGTAACGYNEKVMTRRADQAPGQDEPARPLLESRERQRPEFQAGEDLAWRRDLTGCVSS
jgi:hypothetical protein